MNTSDDKRGGLEVSELTIIDPCDGVFESLGQAGLADELLVGQWYWVGREEEKEKWLGCVMNIGSNYATLRAPARANSYQQVRIHFDDLATTLRFEPNAEQVIAQNVAEAQSRAQAHLSEIQALTRRLGVSRQASLNAPSAQTDSPSNSLMVVSGTQDVKRYEAELIEAKEKRLPELFELVKGANEDMARWLSAQSLPMLAACDGMKDTLDEVSDRIFSVSLYAGLTEQVVQCRDGEPAQYHEKLHIMQRMLFMDEECLLGYRTGGLEFDDIASFDRWLSEDANFQRILPFNRCLVAMRVRRNVKERGWNGRIDSLFVNMKLAESDRFTFLYIRNGEQLHRLSCDMDFGATLFPDRSEFDPTCPKMVRMFGSRVDEIISKSEFDALVIEHERKEALAAQWFAENPRGAWIKNNPRKSYEWANPYYSSGSFSPNEWEPFDSSNVYFDEIAGTFLKKMKEHNRIALIVQGLFDRSEILHPHAPAQIWSPAGFDAAIKLIYDAGAVLHDGEAPDFEAYRRRCNESLGPGSVTIGQEDFWVEKETQKECARLDADWRHRSDYRPTRFFPLGNPGPGFIARIAQWRPRTREAVFTWNRERLTSDRYSGKNYGDPLPTRVAVPSDCLFNVSAYKPGDYLQFFRDPRTRAQYLKWANMLLTAEEYHAGRKMDVGEPI